MSKPLLHPLARKGKENNLVMHRRLDRDTSQSKSVTRQFGRDISNLVNLNNSSRQGNYAVNVSKELSLGQKHGQSHSFGRQESQSCKAVRRSSSSIRSNKSSRDRLKEIGVDTKQQMFRQRVEKQIVQKLQKVDRQSLRNIFEVSEFAAEI